MPKLQRGSILRPSRVSLTNLTSESLGPVVELLADCSEVARHVEDVLRVGVELGKDGLLANAHLEVLQNDVDNPLHLAGVGLADQLS